MKTLQKRFWSKVKKQDNGKCWLWMGCKDPNGYGRFSMPPSRAILAHRLAFELVYSTKIPEGMFACHKCDNPFCVNPNHIFLGTPADNMADAKRKGRMERGEKRYSAKLTRSMVLAIRKEQGPIGKLARQYGVCEALISGILNHKRWKHVPRQRNETRIRRLRWWDRKKI